MRNLLTVSLNRVVFPSLALLAATVLVVPCTALATPINYNFTVNVTSGPLSGSVENGSFSYDSSSIIPGGFNGATGLLTALDFTFNGITYNAGTANTGGLRFDSAGDLTGFEFGDNCSTGSCTISSLDQWWALPGVGGFGYFMTPANPNENDIANGDVTFALAGVPVPEPAVLGMFGLGVLLIGGFVTLRRREQRQA